MRYALLSDIHGNLEALRAVLADAAERTDAVLCLGDIVGYGAEPAACLELIAARATAIVIGNHEYAVVGLMDLRWFNRYARLAAEWTCGRLDDDHRRYLRALPLTRLLEDATLVHASPAHPDEWEYLMTAEDGYEVFGAFTTRLCFVGHSHCPGVWSVGSAGSEHDPGHVDVTLEPGRRYIINVGSVGQPRDRDPRAAYAVWDVAARRVTLHRVAYDVREAQRKILVAGLPRFLADRLTTGS